MKSNYRKRLYKLREQYREQLNEETKSMKQLDLDKCPPKGLNVMLEDCRSLQNVGNVFRTCDGAGFSHIYLTGITGTPPKVEISKTALGSEEVVDWSYSINSLDCIKQLKQRNCKIIGIEQTENSKSLFNSLDQIKELINYKDVNEEEEEEEEEIVGGNNNNSICFIMGNEITGISKEVLDECDLVCDLPMRGIKNSLNISVAFGIVAYISSNKFLNLVLDRSNLK
eukprot:gene2183-2686_t